MSVRALVVDDSKVERMYLTGLLERLGAEVDATGSCDECVVRVCEDEFDIIFIDYFMPDADGVHALKEIQTAEGSLNTETPAIALGTADPVLGDDFFMIQGFRNYIEKPVDMEILHAALLLYLPEEKRGEVGTAAEKESREHKKSLIPPWLSDIKEMNVREGIKNCGGEEGFMSALGIFYSSIEKMADEIQGYYDSENLTDYTIKVHALKSSARIIGLADLSELARKLEAAGDGEDIDFIRENTDHLLSWYRSYKEQFSRLDGDENGKDEAEKPLAEQDFLEDAFSSLEEFAGQMDYDLVEMVISSVEEYRLEPDDKAIFDEVNDAFMSLDWNGIKQSAHKYIEKIYGSETDDESG